MDDNRQAPRFDTTSDIVGRFEIEREVQGQFRNLEAFVIKNISVGGFCLLSNHAPTIGQVHQITIQYENKIYDFGIKVLHSSIHEFLSWGNDVMKAGIVYALGCKVVSGMETQEVLALKIIGNDCAKPQPANPEMGNRKT